MASEIAFMLANEQYIDIATQIANTNIGHDYKIELLAELIDKGIEARLGEIVARLEVSREESNGGIMNDMITDENNAIIDKCIRIVREL